MTIELSDVEAFLVLAEELHFGRTAERTYVSSARVSQRIRTLEREVGGALFTRTSRRVTLTPLGSHLRERLGPAYADLVAALRSTRAAACSPAGELRIGFLATASGSALDRLVSRFERGQRDCRVSLHEVPIFAPLQPLRNGEIDVLVSWLVFGEPDLTMGPTLAAYPRMLAVAADHPLAGEQAVSAEVLGDYPVPNWQYSEAREIRRAFVPERTPSGRPTLVHPTPVRTVAETSSLVARGQAVHPTVASLEQLLDTDRIVLVPITDMPPLPLGLIWCTAHENARIRALAGLATAADG